MGGEAGCDGDWRQAGRTLDVRAFGGDRSALIEILAQVGAAGVRDEGHLRFRIRLGNVRH